MTRDACDGPDVVFEQMPLHANCPSGFDVDRDVVDEETLLGRHAQAGTRRFEGPRVGLADADLVRVDDLLHQFVEVVQRRLALPGADKTVAQDAQLAPAPQIPHERDEFIVRGAQILRPQISHEGLDLRRVEVQTGCHLFVHLPFADAPEAPGPPHVTESLVHRAGRQLQPLLPPLHPSCFRSDLQYAADVENDAGLCQCGPPFRPGRTTEHEHRSLT
jgi:hypothetical protein